MSYQLICGDARHLPLPDESVQMVVTSPPYFQLRDYQVEGQIGLEESFLEYLDQMLLVGQEIWRVLRHDGIFFLNMGDSYATGGKKKSVGPQKDFSSSGLINDGRSEESRRRTYERYKALEAPTRVVPSNSTHVSSRHNPGFLSSRRYSGFQNVAASGAIRPKSLLGQPWRLVFALQEQGWIIRSDIIISKCLSGGAWVYVKSQKGEMPMMIKDLVRLRPDTVQLWNGERWTSVISFEETPRPDNPLEIEFRSGERVGCTGNHLWPTQRGNVCGDELKLGDIVQKCRLPASENFKDPKCLSDIGWFVGLYLAEGSMSDTTIQISGHIDEKDRFYHLCKIATDYHGTCRFHHTTGNAAVIHLYGPVLTGILETYLSGEGASKKHLDVRCWQRSDEFLLSVLMGYLEGDGSYNSKGNFWKLGFCNNDSLASDLRALCARLGCSLRLRRCFHVCGEKKLPGWRGRIRFKQSSHNNSKSDGEIIAIRKSRARKFWDITVEDDPHLFALASGILTHNSNPMPESVSDRPTKSHEYLFMLTKSEKYFYDGFAVREPYSNKTLPQINSDYQGQATKDYASAKAQNPSDTKRRIIESLSRNGGRNKRTVWTMNTEPFSGAHFACFPKALVEPCVLAGTSEYGCCTACGAPWKRIVEKTGGMTGKGWHQHEDDLVSGQSSVYRADGGDEPYRVESVGWEPGCDHESGIKPCVVLDPFCGSGTTGVVAQKHGRDFIGIDISETYLAMARKRIESGK